MAKRKKKKRVAPTCPYCKGLAELTDGRVIYPHRRDLAAHKFWACFPCGAYVGTHKNSPTHAPLGRLADSQLRYWKSQAHAAFDPLWKDKTSGSARQVARKVAYFWLAQNLKIPQSRCHIGRFDVEECRRTVELCEARKR